LAEAGSPRILSALIGSIYDCALDPSLWDQTLAKVRDALDCETAILALWKARDGCLLMHRTAGIPPYGLEQLSKHAPEISRMVDRFSSGLSPDEPLLLSRHVPADFQKASPYVQECLKPAGIVDIMQYFLMHTPTRMAAVAFGRNERQGAVTGREVELGGLLLPHVRRSVTISNILDIRAIERSRMVEALDALQCAVVLSDAHGSILHANSSACAMLRDGGPVRGLGGVLQAKTPAATSELRGAIALAAQGDADIGKVGLAIRLTEDDAPPVFAHVLPLAGGELRTRLRPSAVAAVFISVPADERDGAEAMAAAYGLTRAETRVLSSLLAGQTLAETAAALAIAVSTANSHLDNIFSKTGVNRQADLIRLGMRLASPARKRT
jgi:DNA-binding CsgD family transcriptional regulator